MNIKDCDICGNEIAVTKTFCPFCGARQEEKTLSSKVIFHKTVNIEEGMPFVEPAIKRLLTEISIAQQERVQILTIIHGYGSSGKGGVIRIECRKTLEHLMATKKIQGVIPGEKFSKKFGETRPLLQRFPELSSNRNFNRGNRGITIAVL